MSLALSGSPVLRSALAPASQADPRRPQLRDLPLAARAYWLVILAIGLAALFVHPTHPARPDAGLFLGLLVASSVASTFRVRLPLSHGSSTLSVAYAVDFAALLLLGPDAAMIIAAIGAWVQSTVRPPDRNPVHRTAFNMAAIVLTTQAAGIVYIALGGVLAHQASGLAGLEVPVAAAALTYVGLHPALCAISSALGSGRPLRTTWPEQLLWSVPGYFVGAGVAAAVAFGPSDARIWLAPLMGAPLALTYLTYHFYVGRLDAERRRSRDLAHLHLSTMEALALAIDAKDQCATSRIRRLQVFAAGLAEALGLPEDEIAGVRTAAVLHDIGKLAVPEHILSKPGPLTQEEFQKVRIHPQVGAEIITTVPFPYPVAPLILSHHERWDGKGYPAGLAGDAIPFGARVLAVVDYFDALTSDRPFHAPLSHDDAVAALQEESGRAFDPHIVEVFVRILPRLSAEADRRGEPVPLRSFAPEDGDAGAPAAAETGTTNVFQNIALAHREIYALYEIAHSMGTSLGVSDTMALISSKLSNLVPFSCCALFLFDEASDSLRCRFASGTDAERVQQLTLKPGQGLIGWVARNQRPLVNARPNADFEAAGLDEGTSLRSALVCPLTFGGRLIGVLAVYHDDAGAYSDDHRRLLDRVSEQAAGVVNNSIVYEQTKEDSLTDPLTGLPNTRFMFVHLSRELARAERLRSEVSILVMDLDGFKEINDTYGHHMGDRALREVAVVLRNGIRPYDICVRYAGDEFVVVLSGCGEDEAGQKMHELQDAIAGIKFEPRPGKQVRLGSSFGFAVFPRDGESHETLLAVADKRMYQNKAERKARRDQVDDTGATPALPKRPSVFAKIPADPPGPRTS